MWFIELLVKIKMTFLNTFITSILLSIALLFINFRPINAQPDLPIPPNGIWLYDNIFIDATEVANIHWLEYLHYIRSDSTKEYFESANLDQSVWEELGEVGDNYKTYNTYPKFRYYPVVGISHKQAMAYCKWRSVVVSKKFNERIVEGDSNFKKYKDYEVQIIYRLPTENEWEMAAVGNLDVKTDPFGHEELYGKSISFIYK